MWAPPTQHNKSNPFMPVFKSCLYLIILSLGIISYMYGSLFRSSGRAHNLKVLAINFDDDIIGTAFQTAYTRLQGSDFLTLDFESPSSFSNVDLVTEAICSRGYWGVIYTHAGATRRISQAVSGDSPIPYDPNDTITYGYSGVYYPVIGESYIAPDLLELIAATTQVFYNRYGTNLLSNASSSNAIAASALFQPINPQAVVLSPADTGPRVLLNTITMVVPPLMQFFFVMALDHISIAMHIFSSRTHKRRLYLDRLIDSKAFGFIGALAVTAFIYAFREDWKLSAAQYVETWMCFWFYMDICYQIMDSVIGTVVPMRFAPFFVFTWVIINVTSTLFPFELNPGFYRWGYALPAHNIWLLLMSTWSDGCISRLQIALPVCFAWWVVGHMTSAYAIRRKCMSSQQDHQPPKSGIPAGPSAKEAGHVSHELGSEHDD